MRQRAAPAKRFVPDLDVWEPPAELLELMSQKALRQRDRVELIVAFYAAGHGGNSPTYEKIGDILKTSRGNAYKYAMELTQDSERRAKKMNGQFWLVDSEYSHPVIKSQFFALLHPS